jgi:hypothetical protein
MYSNGQEQHVGLNYNYQINFNHATSLSFGTGLGFNYYRADNDLEPYYDSAGFTKSSSHLNLNFGTAFKMKQLFVGVGISNVTSPQIDLGFTSYTSKPTVVAHASYGIRLTRKFTLTPRAMFLSNNGFRAFHFNTTAQWKSFYLGASWISSRSCGANARWDINRKLSLAYLFKMTFSQLSTTHFAEHELSVGFQIHGNKKIVRYAPPNF